MLLMCCFCSGGYCCTLKLLLIAMNLKLTVVILLLRDVFPILSVILLSLMVMLIFCLLDVFGSGCCCSCCFRLWLLKQVPDFPSGTLSYHLLQRAPFAEIEYFLVEFQCYCFLVIFNQSLSNK